MAIRIYLCNTVCFIAQMYVYGGMLLDLSTILPSGIYEQTFINWDILSVLGANGYMCKIRTSFRKSLDGVFTNIHSHITLSYYVCLCIDVYVWRDVVGYIDNTPKRYLRTHVFPTILCAFGANGYVGDIRTSIRKSLDGIFTNARSYITAVLFVPMNSHMNMYISIQMSATNPHP